MDHRPTPPSLVARIVRAMACASALALLLAVTPVAVVLSGGNPAPQTWQRLMLACLHACMLAAAGEFWLGPYRTVRPAR